jgi:hypothetical protein
MRSELEAAAYFQHHGTSFALATIRGRPLVRPIPAALHTCCYC